MSWSQNYKQYKKQKEEKRKQEEEKQKLEYEKQLKIKIDKLDMFLAGHSYPSFEKAKLSEQDVNTIIAMVSSNEKYNKGSQNEGIVLYKNYVAKALYTSFFNRDTRYDNVQSPQDEVVKFYSWPDGTFRKIVFKPLVDFSENLKTYIGLRNTVDGEKEAELFVGDVLKELETCKEKHIPQILYRIYNIINNDEVPNIFIQQKLKRKIAETGLRRTEVYLMERMDGDLSDWVYRQIRGTNNPNNNYDEWVKLESKIGHKNFTKNIDLANKVVGVYESLIPHIMELQNSLFNKGFIYEDKKLDNFGYYGTDTLKIIKCLDVESGLRTISDDDIYAFKSFTHPLSYSMVSFEFVHLLGLCKDRLLPNETVVEKIKGYEVVSQDPFSYSWDAMGDTFYISKENETKFILQKCFSCYRLIKLNPTRSILFENFDDVLSELNLLKLRF